MKRSILAWSWSIPVARKMVAFVLALVAGVCSVPGIAAAAADGGAPQEKQVRMIAALLLDIGGGPPDLSWTEEVLVGERDSLESVYHDISYGRLELEIDMLGPYVLPEPACLPPEGGGPQSSHPNGAELRAIIDGLERTYDHHFWIYGDLPPGADCQTWGEQGSVETPGRFASFSLHSVAGYAHEFGHNLGMVHEPMLDCPGSVPLADDPTNCNHHEYGNTLSFMGLGSGHPSAFQKARQGWFRPSNVVRLDGSASVALESLEIATDEPQWIVVPAPKARLAPERLADGSPAALDHYYLELRTPRGLGIEPQPIPEPMVLVSLGPDPDDSAGGAVYALDLIPEKGELPSFDNAGLTHGQTFNDPTRGLAISVETLDESRATVSVTFRDSSAPSCSLPPARVASSSVAGLVWLCALVFGWWRRLAVGGALLLSACRQEQPTASLVVDAGTDSTSEATGVNLACIEPILTTNCALSGCHDAETHEHSLDLSTGPSIYDALVDRNGLNVCGGRLEKRVVPGEPDNSLLIKKVTGLVDCSNSQRMPPSPTPPLTQEEIETLRTWIALGAPADCPPDLIRSGGVVSGAGGVASAAANVSTVSTTGGMGAADSGAGGATTMTSGSSGTTGTTSTTGSGGTGGTIVDDGSCTGERPCGDTYLCAGSTCSDVWYCIGHKPHPVSAHPCSMNIIPFCGCDGMTFESPQDCPDRPWDRAGACEDGFNCDPWRAECEDDPPTCAEGEVPSVVDGCWGDCVVAESCRCVYHWQCGDVPEYACNLETFFCEPSPPSE